MRAVASHTGAELASSRAPGGTRKVALLTGAPGGILRNFHTYYNGLWARVGWVQAGHQGHPIQSLLDKGRRLAGATFVSFVLLVRDFFEGVLRPFAKAVQGMGEPSQLEAIASRFWAKLAKQKVAWRVCQKYLTVIALCRQHAPASDLVALWRTLGARWVGAVCSGFFDGAVEIWRASPAKFQGVELVIPQGTHLVHNTTRTRCIGPH